MKKIIRRQKVTKKYFCHLNNEQSVGKKICIINDSKIERVVLNKDSLIAELSDGKKITCKRSPDKIVSDAVCVYDNQLDTFKLQIIPFGYTFPSDDEEKILVHYFYNNYYGYLSNLKLLVQINPVWQAPILFHRVIKELSLGRHLDIADKLLSSIPPHIFVTYYAYAQDLDNEFQEKVVFKNKLQINHSPLVEIYKLLEDDRVPGVELKNEELVFYPDSIPILEQLKYLRGYDNPTLYDIVLGALSGFNVVNMNIPNIYKGKHKLLNKLLQITNITNYSVILLSSNMRVFYASYSVLLDVAGKGRYVNSKIIGPIGIARKFSGGAFIGGTFYPGDKGSKRFQELGDEILLGCCGRKSGKCVLIKKFKVGNSVEPINCLGGVPAIKLQNMWVKNIRGIFFYR